ncbi:ester cyclase [Simkania sp.]|uniref:ester cyclase n=1 Tax=Simkania sp. TaxID=34094 RepID=UPI003B52580C
MRRFLLVLLLLPLFAFAEEPLISQIVTPRGETNPQTYNKETVKDFYTAFQKNNPQALDELLKNNYGVQDSTVVFDSAYSKYDAFSKNMKVRLASLHKAFRDLDIKIIEMMADGNKVMARVQMTGVQTGSFLGVEATNKPVVIKVFAIFTFDGGKISHINEVWNELGVMKQIGYIVL